LTAALLNGVAGHALDFDDEDAHVCGHPGTVVIPAVLAVAEEFDLRGEAAFQAICAGYEVAARLGQVANPEHYANGWHATSTLGTIAAAGAVSRLLELSEEETIHALNISGTQAGGVRAVFGSDVKAFQAGRAAYAGVLSAKLAKVGTRATSNVLSGRLGYFRASGIALDSSLWQSWQDDDPPAVTRAIFKAHSVCGAGQCLIEAVAGTVKAHGLNLDEIEKITGAVSDLSRSIANVQTPGSFQDAQFSLSHVAALAATVYPIVPDALKSSLSNDEVSSFREKVSIVNEPSFAGDLALPASATITTVGGQQFTTTVMFARGTIQDPLSDADLVMKFRANSAGSLADESIESLLGELWSFGPLTSIRQLLAPLEGKPQ